MAQIGVFRPTLSNEFGWAPASAVGEEMPSQFCRQVISCHNLATGECGLRAKLYSRICKPFGPFKILTQKQQQKSARVGALRVARMTVHALQGGQRAPRRLVDVIRTIPRISKAYFKSPFRRALYGGISLLVGFYVAQTISLTFGALGINDVIAAAICLLFTEYVTKFYHTRVQMTFAVGLLNNFKMGFTYGLFIDAFKLAS